MGDILELLRGHFVAGGNRYVHTDRAVVTEKVPGGFAAVGNVVALGNRAASHIW